RDRGRGAGRLLFGPLRLRFLQRLRLLFLRRLCLRFLQRLRFLFLRRLRLLLLRRLRLRFLRRLRHGRSLFGRLGLRRGRLAARRGRDEGLTHDQRAAELAGDREPEVGELVVLGYAAAGTVELGEGEGGVGEAVVAGRGIPARRRVVVARHAESLLVG